jgi:hypothetical protein
VKERTYSSQGETITSLPISIPLSTVQPNKLPVSIPLASVVLPSRAERVVSPAWLRVGGVQFWALDLGLFFLFVCFWHGLYCSLLYCCTLLNFKCATTIPRTGTRINYGMFLVKGRMSRWTETRKLRRTCA